MLGSFNDAFEHNSLYSIEWNGEWKWWIRENVETSGRGIFEVISHHLPRGAEENYEYCRSEAGIRDRPNTKRIMQTTRSVQYVSRRMENIHRPEGVVLERKISKPERSRGYSRNVVTSQSTCSVTLTNKLSSQETLWGLKICL